MDKLTAIVRTVRERFRRWWSQFNQGNYPPDFDAVLARMDAENGSYSKGGN